MTRWFYKIALPAIVGSSFAAMVSICLSVAGITDPLVFIFVGLFVGVMTAIWSVD